jgi:nucleoside-diphosphate-sugar epimerase
MSCLARERVFEYGSKTYGTPVCLFRLNYAVDLRYGVLYDIAQQIMSGTPIRVATPVFNCIWQGSANEAAIRSLTLCESPASILNVTGPETVSVKWAALELGKYLGKDVLFEGNPDETASGRALVSNASKMFDLFGYPEISIHTLIKWQAEWILDGGRALGKPTHFEEQKGKF